MSELRYLAFDGKGDDREILAVNHPYFTRSGEALRDDDQPEPMTSPLQAAALRFACHLEPRTMEAVADDLDVSVQAISSMVARINQRLGFRRTRKMRTAKP